MVRVWKPVYKRSKTSKYSSHVPAKIKSLENARTFTKIIYRKVFGWVKSGRKNYLAAKSFLTDRQLVINNGIVYI